jgi:hypothetical protein
MFSPDGSDTRIFEFRYNSVDVMSLIKKVPLFRMLVALETVI